MQFKVYKRRVKDTFYGKTTDTAVGVQTQEMADARMGAMYMLAKTDYVKVPSFSAGHLFDNFVVGAEPLSDLKNVSMAIIDKTGVASKTKSLIEKSETGKKLIETVSVVGEATSAVIQKIKTYISEFFRGLVEKAKLVYGDVLEDLGWFAEYAGWMVAEFAGNLSSLIPGWGYVQNAVDIYSGVKQAIFKSKDLITQMYAGRGVELLGGHPSIIANALARHSAVGVAGGLKKTAIATTKIGLEAAGDAFAGVGTLVSALSGMLERVVNFFDYMIQRSLVRKVLKKARKEWDKRGSTTSMLNDHKTFSEWFQSAVVTTPIIAALVMGSGFVAHPMKFLSLMSSTEIVSQAEYNKGVNYIDKLKDLSASYVQEYTDGYSVEFTSEDKLVAARLSELTTGKGILHGEEFVVESVTRNGLGAIATTATAFITPRETTV
ncbi:hypothetical protein MACH09_35580 [Vibrio sp. MACH09]|uniref:hypothetical protein n=1 Tax=unclassified Vibrio TaxID=2614977 RepID=UPI0020A2CD25|nr:MULTISPECIES: hypothetical protein [unclassified Vibrio]GLO63050.1 hypothetical protein MACH09_35580 [Vibrio sp. MACH09]